MLLSTVWLAKDAQILISGISVSGFTDDISHAYEKMRRVQIAPETFQARDKDGIDQACDTLHKLWMGILAETGDPVAQSQMSQ
jgi:hypothetical protein